MVPDREACELARVMQLYNICVVVLNAYIAYEMVVTAYHEKLALMYVRPIRGGRHGDPPLQARTAREG